MLWIGRLRVRWVNCRIREHFEVARCFRFQGYGHESRGCALPARKDACWRCEGASLVAQECKATLGPFEIFETQIHLLEEILRR